MTRNDEIILCRTARLDDAGTRHSMRDIVLPSLRKEADELEACRLQCETRADWLDDWVSTGMLTEEVTIRQAIAHAEKRLAEYVCLYRVVIEMPITGDFTLEYANRAEAEAGMARARRKVAFAAYPMRVEPIIPA